MHLFRDTFLCLVSLIPVSVPVRTKIRCDDCANNTQYISKTQITQGYVLLRILVVQMENLTETKIIQAIEMGQSPGEVLYIHQHCILLHMQLISQQQQLHQLLV